MSAIECDPSSSWWAFLTVAVGLYVLGLAASSFAALVLSRNALRGRLLCTSEAFTRLLSPNTLSGKLLTVFGLFCNSVYLSLALYYTTLPVERCVETTSSTLLLELFISSALVGLFVLRILSSARGPLQHWLSLLVVVDVFTLPHTFLVLLLSRDWLGLRTLRFLWLTEAANLFTIFSWCTISQDVLKVVKLVLRLVSIWLAMAGLVQMLEASGDPWDDSGLVQNLTYLESAYFIIVTMSTVGYGDIFPITVSGRVVVTVFILTGLAVYTTALPTLVNIAVMYYNTSQFTGNHSAIVSNQYVVVCGHVTAISAAGFLKELLHPDRHDTTTRIIFLHPDTPSTELRQVLKTNYTRVEYLIGSPLSTCDLHRCGLEKARACVVLADRFSNDPLAEDRANLLQVASLKNTSSSTLVILQLLCGCSKELLASIPCWSHHDVVICFYELKLKILAQSCLTPGFATLISNLFFVSSPHHLPLQNGLWKTLYTQGACKEIYSSILSPTFNGMRVPEVAQVCFREMGLLLIAVVNGQESGGFLQRSVIQNRATGYFIADTAHDVECVRYFCIRCRKKLCHCNLSPERTRQSCFTSSAQSISYAVSPMTSSHSCSTPLQQRNVEGLINHIVLCVFASADSTGIGLHNFLAPLASSCDVVIVCNATNYLNQEMMYISQYPRVHIIKGSPLEWNSLLRAGVQQSRLCVILTAPRHIREIPQDMVFTPFFVLLLLCVQCCSETAGSSCDKEAVLCSLLLRKRLQNKVAVLTDFSTEEHIHLLGTSLQMNQPSFLAESFIFGQVFLSSVFNSMTVVAFHSPGTVTLVERLLQVGHQPACGNMVQLSLSSELLAQYAKLPFSSLFQDLARRDIICIGLYRQLNNGAGNRYVITAPDPDLQLHNTDMVLAVLSP